MRYYGLIYGYPQYVGQVQSLELLRRHSVHKTKHPDWPEPVILEIVSGESKEDLIFNLTWAETVWIFKRHTYKPIWSNGLNKLIPFSRDYENIGKLGGGIRPMSKTSYTRMIKGIGNTPEARKRHVLGSRKGGLRAKATPRHYTADSRKRLSQAGKLGRSLVFKKDIIKAARLGGKIGNHQRWHVNRSIALKSCELCS